MSTASRSYYKRFYRLVAVAVAVMTAVLTGSLLLGDSVRGSLMERVNERLGDAETLILTGTGFLSDSILTPHSTLLAPHSSLFKDARGCLLAEGFVSSNGQMIPVTVWGTDKDSLRQGDAMINNPLFTLLTPPSTLHAPQTFVLHLPSNNLVGSGSLFVSQSYSTQLRLSVKGIKTGEEGGNLLLRNEQVRPLNVFMNRQELAEALGVEGKVNVILSPQHISEQAFKSIWKPQYSGLRLQDSIVSTDRVFLPQAVVDALKPTARYLAYFVNSMGDIPYSFVTATDQLQGDETILSDYAARRINAHVGDSVTMEYYVSRGGLKQLETRSHRFCVSSIVPLSEFQQQAALLTADFPGLSGVKHCTDWDSDLPIDMSRITRSDEDYWETYRQTPKALVSLDAVGSDWIGAYGVATKVVTSNLLPLTSHLFNIAVVHPRQAALLAAQNGTDFGMLFLALGFFIIIAAILLMQTPLSEMYLLRRPEIRLFSTLGFSRRQVSCRLSSEALPVVLMSAPFGVLLGYAYATVILWLLAGPWSGATHTDGFVLHSNALTVLISLIISVVLAVIVLCLAVRSVFRQQIHQEVQPRTGSLLRASLHYYRRQHRLSFWTLATGVLVVFAVGLNRPDFSHSSAAATGGYEYYGESRIPIQYDLNTAAGRHHLHLDDLPANARFLQLPKHTEDEASCLNLNKVETPSVLGMSLENMASFGIDIEEGGKRREERGYLVPVYIDEEALLWSMMKQEGDTLTYHAADGREVKAVIAGTYPTGILHGNAIMPLDCFRELWPDEMGCRIVLSSLHTSPSTLLPPLSDYGFTLTTTRERLMLFFEVTDTYLWIFLSLGGLGLLLGLVSLLIVIRKNLTARRYEIRLYHTLGFPTEQIVSMLRREQSIVPLVAILAGAVISVVISYLLPLTSYFFSATALVLLLLMLLMTWIIIKISINSKTIKQCEMY